VRVCAVKKAELLRRKLTDLMHDDAKDTGVVEVPKQSDAVASFHSEPATKVADDRHKPVLHRARVTAVANHNSVSTSFK